MGKLFKGALLGAASALGAYYYKNPKEFEKHKELVKENAKLGLEKLNAIVIAKVNEAANVQETDVAREKLAEVAASEGKVEDNFVSLSSENQERIIPKTSAVPEGYVQEEQALEEELEKEEAEENYEEIEEGIEENLAEEVAPVFEEEREEIQDKSETLVEEVASPEELVAQKNEEKEEVAASFGEVVEENPYDNLENLTEEQLAALEAELAKEEAELNYEEEEVKEEVIEKKEEKSKTTLDSIVSLFASREDNK